VTISLQIVAFAFTIAALFCLMDIPLAKPVPRQWLRAFQFVAVAMMAFVYWRASSLQAIIPPVEVRIPLVALAVLICSEIISRWSIGGNRK
jgi:hypothetical protein